MIINTTNNTAKISEGESAQLSNLQQTYCIAVKNVSEIEEPDVMNHSRLAYINGNILIHNKMSNTQADKQNFFTASCECSHLCTL